MCKTTEAILALVKAKGMLRIRGRTCLKIAALWETQAPGCKHERKGLFIQWNVVYDGYPLRMTMPRGGREAFIISV